MSGDTFQFVGLVSSCPDMFAAVFSQLWIEFFLRSKERIPAGQLHSLILTGLEGI